MKHLWIMALALSACAPNIAEYMPVVDPSKTDMNQFERDLVQCRGIGIDAKANYDQQASKQAAGNLIAGAVVGAAVGATVGRGTGYQGELTRYGAATGALQGSASASQTVNQGGPNRIIDRCMANRGYAILNDIGQGFN